MKRLLALVCMITCIFGLTACGSETELTEFEQNKLTLAEELAVDTIVPMCEAYSEDTVMAEINQYTFEEIEYILESQQILVDGYAFTSALSSFNSALEEIGEIVSIGEAVAEIDDDQIMVIVPIDGSVKDAEAEIIFSNDMFMVLESAALNPIATLGDAMAKAALNTLIGMGTVFAVLILIIFIISAFNLIPKVQKFFENKKDKKAVDTAGIDKAVAQIEQQEESDELSDDMELVAVIAAAVAAYEGSASTDGFVVRSIRKARR